MSELSKNNPSSLYYAGKKVLALRKRSFFQDFDERFKDYNFSSTKKPISVFRIVQRNFLTDKMLLTTNLLVMLCIVVLFGLSIANFVNYSQNKNTMSVLLLIASCLTLFYLSFKIINLGHKLQLKRRSAEFFVKNMYTGKMIFDLPFIPNMYFDNRLASIRLKWAILLLFLYPGVFSIFLWYGSSSSIVSLADWTTQELSLKILNRELSSKNLAIILWISILTLTLFILVRIFFRKLAIVEMEHFFGKEIFSNIAVEKRERLVHIICASFVVPFASLPWICWRKSQSEPLLTKYNYFSG